MYWPQQTWMPDCLCPYLVLPPTDWKPAVNPSFLAYTGINKWYDRALTNNIPFTVFLHPWQTLLITQDNSFLLIFRVPLRVSRTAGSLSVGRVWHVRCHPFAFSISGHRTQFLACGRLWVNPTTQSVLRAGILNFLLTHPHQQGAPSGCPFLCWAVLRIQIFPLKSPSLPLPFHSLSVGL